MAQEAGEMYYDLPGTVTNLDRHEHELKKLTRVYDNTYGCDVCEKSGIGVVCTIVKNADTMLIRNVLSISTIYAEMSVGTAMTTMILMIMTTRRMTELQKRLE